MMSLLWTSASTNCDVRCTCFAFSLLLHLENFYARLVIWRVNRLALVCSLALRRHDDDGRWRRRRSLPHLCCEHARFTIDARCRRLCRVVHFSLLRALPLARLTRRLSPVARLPTRPSPPSIGRPTPRCVRKHLPLSRSHRRSLCARAHAVEPHARSSASPCSLRVADAGSSSGLVVGLSPAALKSAVL